jgi:hypothetical protein
MIITMRRRMMLSLGLASVVIGSAGAQRSGTPVLTAADLPAQLAATTRQAIARLGDSLRAAHLPDEPLYAKAAEGVLKGADDARIVAATRRLARELSEARTSLGSGADDAELVAGASALHVGASAATLRQLRDTHLAGARDGASLATPLVALADLLTRRVPALVAAAAIDSLVARRAPSDDFAALRAAVERDIDAGRAPEASVVQRTQGLLRNIEGRRRTP